MRIIQFYNSINTFRRYMSSSPCHDVSELQRNMMSQASLGLLDPESVLELYINLMEHKILDQENSVHAKDFLDR